MPVHSHFNNIQEVIVDELNAAEKQVIVAVAWLTNQTLFDKLCLLADNYIDVQLLIVKDEINLNSGCDFKKLIKSGGKLYWQENSSSALMHHKFCVVDKKTVITGSYNWTNKAASNIENITILKNEINAAIGYYEEFKSLVPRFEEAVFFEAGLQSADYFNTPEKRLDWYNGIPETLRTTFEYYAQQLIWKYDSEGYVILNEDLDDIIAAIFKIPAIIVSGINTLKSLESLTALKDLTVMADYGPDMDKKISDLYPIRNLINLIELKLDSQNITEVVHLSKLKKLQELNLERNNIKSLKGLENLERLKYLEVSRNKIESLNEISGCKRLIDFRCNNNKVMDARFLGENSSLERVELQNNLVEDISFLSNCKKLKNITISNNRITDIEPLLKLKELQYLYVDGNPISFEKVERFRKTSKAYVAFDKA